MGLFDIFGKFKKNKVSEAEMSQPILPPQPVKTQPETVSQPMSDSDSVKLKIELLLSEMDGLRTQMEMINERLKIIERKLDQKGTIRYV